MAIMRCLGMLLKQYGHLSKVEDIFLCSVTILQHTKAVRRYNHKKIITAI